MFIELLDSAFSDGSTRLINVTLIEQVIPIGKEVKIFFTGSNDGFIAKISFGDFIEKINDLNLLCIKHYNHH
jgi:hypothetical protein